MLKTSTLVMMLGSVLGGLPVVTHAQEMKDQGAFTTVLVGQLKTVLNADSVLGKPLDFAGTKIMAHRPPGNADQERCGTHYSRLRL